LIYPWNFLIALFLFIVDYILLKFILWFTLVNIFRFKNTFNQENIELIALSNSFVFLFSEIYTDFAQADFKIFKNSIIKSFDNIFKDPLFF
jgi:hypothetical protein